MVQCETWCSVRHSTVWGRVLTVWTRCSVGHGTGTVCDMVQCGHGAVWDMVQCGTWYSVGHGTVWDTVNRPGLEPTRFGFPNLRKREMDALLIRPPRLV